MSKAGITFIDGHLKGEFKFFDLKASEYWFLKPTEAFDDNGCVVYEIVKYRRLKGNVFKLITN